MAGILAGLRVVDFGRYISGPFCATLLGDLGAEVIRVEKLNGSEDRYTVPITPEGEGAYFAQLGRNKKSITLNPAKPEGRAVTDRLIKTADVVVVNLPAPSLEKMGLEYTRLKSLKPDIILVVNSAFGSTGPYAQRGGFDTVAQAMSGNMHLSGEEGKPGKSFAPYCDFGTAAFSAFGALAAILHRFKTGEGQLVEGSLLSTALTFNNAALIEQAVHGLDRQGSGTRGQYNAPTDAFPTTDGWIMVQVVGQGIFERWTRLTDARHLEDHPQCRNDQDRGDFAKEIGAYMRTWIQSRTSEEALTELTEAGIPAGKILNPAEVLSDHHIQESGLIQMTDHNNGLPSLPIAEHPVSYSATETLQFSPPPPLGAHTTELLTELGFSEQEIMALKEKRVV